MKILAIETAGSTGSVAALSGADLVMELQLDSGQRSAQSLAPAIKRLLELLGWRPKDIRLVAVVIGPGSFTGLRIGVMTAKAFAYAIGAHVSGVDTLAVIASQMPAPIDHLDVVWDAQRGQVFAQSFQVKSAGQPVCRTAVEIKDRSDWVESLVAGQCVAGPPVETLQSQLPAGVIVAPPGIWFPTAAAAGRLALQKWNAGLRHDLWTLAPQYHRRSAAEEKAGLGCRNSPWDK